MSCIVSDLFFSSSYEEKNEVCHPDDILKKSNTFKQINKYIFLSIEHCDNSCFSYIFFSWASVKSRLGLSSER